MSLYEYSQGIGILARERSEARAILTPLQSWVLSSGLTTVTSPSSVGKRYPDRRPWKGKGENRREEESEIDMNQYTICFCSFSVAWLSEDNDVIINRTLSYQIRALYSKVRARFFFLWLVGFSREFFYCHHVQRWYFMKIYYCPLMREEKLTIRVFLINKSRDHDICKLNIFTCIWIV